MRQKQPQNALTEKMPLTGTRPSWACVVNCVRSLMPTGKGQSLSIACQPPGTHKGAKFRIAPLFSVGIVRAGGERPITHDIAICQHAPILGQISFGNWSVLSAGSATATPAFLRAFPSQGRAELSQHSNRNRPDYAVPTQPQTLWAERERSV